MQFFSKLKWAFYDLSVKLFGNKKKAPTKPSTVKRNTNIFLITLLAFPVLQFIVFYFGVNFNSILLAFKKVENGKYVFGGFENFERIINDIFVNTESGLPRAIKNSSIQFLITIVGIPLHVMVAYCIFKKVPFSGAFKIMLFLPSIISSMVFVNTAQYLFQRGIPSLFPSMEGVNMLDQYANIGFVTVLCFGVWMTFAGGLVIYLSAMSSISIDIIEYGKLEDMNSWQELWYIVVPLIFPTITTYIVVAFAGFFTNYGYFLAFYGGSADSPKIFDTLGYVFFVKIMGDGRTSNVGLMKNYPYTAAGGLIFTIICAPITISVKKLLEKFGPSEE